MLSLRNISVGIDTIGYYNSFNNIKLVSLSQALDVEIEHGYILIQYLIGRVFGEFQFLLVTVALLFITVVSYLVYKHSNNPMLSYTFFIIYGFYTFAMSGTRQTMAIALIMIAFHFVINKNLIKFLFFLLLATTFHITAIIFLPAYWFSKFKFNKKTILTFILLAVIIILQKNIIIDFLVSNARIEYTLQETGGEKLYFFIVFTVLLGIVYRKKLEEKSKNNKYFFYMMMASMLILPITQFHPVLFRLLNYYFIFMIIYIPNLLYAIDNKVLRVTGIFGYVITGFIFFRQTITVSRLEDYLFFWQ